MKTKSKKGLKGVTIFVSLLCVVNIVWILCQSYFVSTDSGEGCIEWHEDFYPVQLAIFAGRLIFKTAFYALIILFMVKQCKAIRNGTIFPRANIAVIYTMAACYFIGEFCNSNMEPAVMFCGSSAAIEINIDIIIYTILLVAFGILYKVAVDVSEENNLTI